MHKTKLRVSEKDFKHLKNKNHKLLQEDCIVCKMLHCMVETNRYFVSLICELSDFCRHSSISNSHNDIMMTSIKNCGQNYERTKKKPIAIKAYSTLAVALN